MDTQKQDIGLADPDERPGSDVVIYDGKCRFCIGQVRRLARWDRRHQLSFLSLHDPRARELCPDLTSEQLMEQLYLVTADGKRYGGAAAARYLSRQLPRLWLLAPVLHLPGSLPLWQWLYRQFAKRRYWFGRTDRCETDSCDVHLK